MQYEYIGLEAPVCSSTESVSLRDIRKSDSLMFPSLGVYLYPWSRKMESGESEEYCTYHSPKTLLNRVKNFFEGVTARIQ